MNYHEWTSLFNIYIQKGGSFAFSISKIYKLINDIET